MGGARTDDGPAPRVPPVKLTVTASGSVRLEVHAKPRAKKSRVVGVHGEALSVSLAAPPVDGAANDEVVRFLADLFGVPRAKVTLVRGASARVKLLEVAGTTVSAIAERLATILASETAR